MTGRARSERALLGLLAAVTATGPVALNIYVPVVPLARADLGISVAAASVTVTAPLLAFALGLLAWGPLSDRYGRRPVILAGLAVFLAGSLAAYLAPSVGWLALARVVVALGSSAGVTVARAALGDRYSHERMAHRLATLTMVMVLANSLAPTLGGVLGEAFGWRTVFLVLLGGGLPIGLLALRYLPETRAAHAPRGVREIGAATLELVRRRAFLGYAFQSAVIYAVFFVFIALVPYVFQHLGRGAAEYGAWYVTLSAGYFLGNFVVSRAAVRIGMARLMTAGIALQAVAALAGFALARGGVWHPAALFLPWTVIGFGQGLALPNLTASAVALAPRHAGTASGLLGFGQQFLGAVAVQAMAVTSTATPVPVTSFVAAAATVALAAHLAARAAGRQTAAPAPG